MLSLLDCYCKKADAISGLKENHEKRKILNNPSGFKFHWSDVTDKNCARQTRERTKKKKKTKYTVQKGGEGLFKTLNVPALWQVQLEKTDMRVGGCRREQRTRWWFPSPWGRICPRNAKQPHSRSHLLFLLQPRYITSSEATARRCALLVHRETGVLREEDTSDICSRMDVFFNLAYCYWFVFKGEGVHCFRAETLS